MFSGIVPGLKPAKRSSMITVFFHSLTALDYVRFGAALILLTLVLLPRRFDQGTTDEDGAPSAGPVRL
jgi:hypothetical protein